MYICKICGHETDWDHSCGRPCYIVCNSCVRKIAANAHLHEWDAIKVVCAIGWSIEEREEK